MGGADSQGGIRLCVDVEYVSGWRNMGAPGPADIDKCIRMISLCSSLVSREPFRSDTAAGTCTVRILFMMMD